MNFDRLYSLISEEVPADIQVFTPEELKKGYIILDIGFSDEIAKIAYNFIKHNNEYSAAKVVCYYKPALSKRTGYYIIVPSQAWSLERQETFKKELWEYGLRNKIWNQIFRNPEQYYLWMGTKPLKNSPQDDITVWDYDPMQEYSSDPETKDAWKGIIDEL